MNIATWMRSFTIRTRMHGAIAMVLAMFAAIGLTGLAGGKRLASLNEDFMHHSVKEVGHVSAIRQSLAEVRLAELFGEHMVLQRDRPLKLWGRATPGQTLAVDFAGRTARVPVAPCLMSVFGPQELRLVTLPGTA